MTLLKLLAILLTFPLCGCLSLMQAVAEKEEFLINEDYKLSGKPLRFVAKYCFVNSVGGAYPDIAFYNTSSKTIKYCYVEFTFYNAVGDRATCSHDGASSSIGKIVGPITPNSAKNASYDPMIYDSSTTGVEITALTIEYMDGNMKNFTREEINSFGPFDWNSQNSNFLDKNGWMY